MLQNLQALSPTTWLIAGTVIGVVSLGLWWFRRNFTLDEIELPFKFKFKRREKPVQTPTRPELVEGRAKERSLASTSSANGVTSPAPTLRPAREFGDTTVSGGVGITGDSVRARDIAGEDQITAQTVIKDSVIGFAPASVSVALPGSSLPPPRAAKFVDRGPIMDDLRRALHDRTAAALVGVGGMGGVGKTELARFLADEIENAQPGIVVWITVSDRPVSDVHAALARALGLTLPPNLDAEGRAELLRAALQQSPRVIILDDVRAEFAPDLRLCLPPSPPCAALITSRRRELPGLPAGAVRALDVMTKLQALELLRGVPGLAEPVNREEAAAEALCALCGYHPLALDLAARRLLKRLRDSGTPLAAFNANLKDRLAQLKTGEGEGPQESLTSNFELSYLDLSEADQTRFRRLAAFAPSGFAPRAAATLWDEVETDARAALDRLEDASLLLPAEVSGRYRLHDLLHDYAADKLHAEGGSEAEAAHRPLAEFLIALFEAHYTTDPNAAPEVTPELDNLRAAAAWAQTVGDGNLLARLATQPRNWLYNVFRAWEDWEAWLTGALRLGIDDRGLRANVLKAMGDVQQFRDDRDAALQSYQQALGLYRAVGDRLGEANVLQALGDVQQFRQETDAALRSYQQALALYRAVGAKLGEANVLYEIGNVQQFRDDRDAALQSYQQALALFRAVGSRVGEANVLAALSLLSLQAGDLRAAEKLLEEAIALRRATGARYSEGADYFNFALALLNLGKRAEAKAYALKAKAVFDRLGEPHLVRQVDELIAGCEEK